VEERIKQEEGEVVYDENNEIVRKNRVAQGIKEEIWRK